jgi:hypothetical protein
MMIFQSFVMNLDRLGDWGILQLGLNTIFNYSLKQIFLHHRLTQHLYQHIL